MLEAEADQESLWCGVAASEAPEEVGRAPRAAGLEPDLLELAGHFGGRLTVLETGLGVGGEDVRSDHPRPELSVVTSRPVTLRDQNKPRFFFTFIPNLSASLQSRVGRHPLALCRGQDIGPPASGRGHRIAQPRNPRRRKRGHTPP